MSRGAFRMLYRAYYNIDTRDDSLGTMIRPDDIDEEDLICDHVFIPAAEILVVKVFQSLEELYDNSDVIFTSEDKTLADSRTEFYSSFWTLVLRYYNHHYLQMGCKCGAFNTFNAAAYTCDFTKAGAPMCTCDLAIFPVYEVTVRNHKMEICQRDGKSIHPLTMSYIVHPDEREHMERYLAGTDDPISDLVHEFRFNPMFRGQMSAEQLYAKEDLASGGMKRLLDQEKADAEEERDTDKKKKKREENSMPSKKYLSFCSISLLLLGFFFFF